MEIFSILVLTNLLIGFPVAWLIIDEFLAGFTYHVESDWMLFLLTAFLMLGLTFLSVGYQPVKAAWINPVQSLQNER